MRGGGRGDARREIQHRQTSAERFHRDEGAKAASGDVLYCEVEGRGQMSERGGGGDLLR